jgi:hypothetical protein
MAIPRLLGLRSAEAKTLDSSLTTFCPVRSSATSRPGGRASG